MKAKKIVVTAIMCAMVSFGIGGTSSAATPSNALQIATVESTVETQELGMWSHHGNSMRRNHNGGYYQNTNVGAYQPSHTHYPPHDSHNHHHHHR